MNCEQRYPVRKDGQWWNAMIFLVCRRHAFRVLLVETYRIISIPSNHRVQHRFAGLDHNRKFGMVDPMKDIFNLRKWFYFSVHSSWIFQSSHAKTPPSRLRQNALRPGREGRPPPGDGPPKPSLLAASGAMTRITHLKLLVLSGDIIRYYQILSDLVYQTFWILWELNDQHMRKHDPSKVLGSLYHSLVDHQTWG